MKESLADEIVAHFEKNHGPVDPLAQIEIVPTTSPPIAIHIIQPGEKRPYLTLFTTGMSDEAMTVPEGNDEFRFAELFIQLPPDWPFKQGEPLHPDGVWLMQWLRQVAGYIHANETWLGGPVTLFANGDPPEPLAPHVPFTTLLLLAKEHFVSEDGRTIQLYHVTPLHTQERDLELRRGIAALMHALDREKVSFVVDLDRKSVAKGGPWYLTPLVWLGCGLFLLIPLLLLLWIWIPGMGWASLGVFAAFLAVLVVVRLIPDPNE